MRITVNGEAVELDADLTVTRLLAVRNVRSPFMVSVELNGRILKPAEIDTTVLHEGDTVEFVYFMGGGAWT